MFRQVRAYIANDWTALGTLARLPSPFNVVMASSNMAAASLLE